MRQLLVCALAVAFAAPAAAEPLLRQRVEVESDVVRLGDLVEDAGPLASIALFRAPEVGAVGVIAADRVVALAAASGLPGVNPRGVVEVRVVRRAAALTAEAAASLVAKAAANAIKGSLPSRIEVNFDTPLSPQALAGIDARLARLTDFAYDAASGRFTARVSAEVGERVGLALAGRAVEMIEVATLAADEERDHKLSREDIVLRRVPRDPSKQTPAVDVNDLLGRVTRRPMRAGEVLQAADLIRPTLIQRNAMVTVTYRKDGLVLSARGKALSSGAAGDVVDVQNLQSKRVIQGVVTGTGEVAVTPVAQPHFTAALP